VSKRGADGSDVFLRTLSDDDVFGERGLIARAPRAATVTAETNGRVFAMEGDDFLELVGGRASVRERLMTLYDSPVDQVGRG
jgi:CRP-like cAMP-binding protein